MPQTRTPTAPPRRGFSTQIYRSPRSVDTREVELNARQRVIIDAIGSITIDDIPKAVSTGIEIMEKQKDLTGFEKKIVLTKALLKLVEDHSGTLEPILTRLVPHLIDTLVTVSDSGGLQVNKNVKHAAMSMCGGCFSFKGQQQQSK